MNVRAWAELLRIPGVFTVPGDVLAGAAAGGGRPGRRAAAAVGASVCLYEAGMVLNDWADRAEDAVERPHRPLPSGRITPGAALGAAVGLTVAGVGLAACAGRPALTVSGALAGAVWAYDMGLKHTRAGPAAMAAARGLDLLLGAAATTGRVRPALFSAAVLAGHTCAVTAVSRQETRGGAPLVPLAGLAVTGAVAGLAGRGLRGELPAPVRPLAATARTPSPTTARTPSRTAARAAALATYAVTVGRPLLHAALNPSPQLTQRAVGAGIRAMVPLQAALSARAGATGSAVVTAGLAPLARRFARRVSIT
ncbi:SCO3242 family prenyltransferase [Streptomyces luteolus]|uniref:UbiA family prenyltransferase n=1 Tax=Streptomyces luteolus TaxID=3043615 RepID=A0ABT6T7M7_9ACTN|nr:UbiA family prenyltransferase [Streptomyces sp. B-S-A12]MDI3423680.1 UbiA family prenyltransferase [Streptomyces sp. B-S-A12]